MRIAIAGLVLVIASTLVACVHETTVFHSLNGSNYFRGDGAMPADALATAPPPSDEPVPSR